MYYNHFQKFSLKISCDSYMAQKSVKYKMQNINTKISHTKNTSQSKIQQKKTKKCMNFIRKRLLYMLRYIDYIFLIGSPTVNIFKSLENLSYKLRLLNFMNCGTKT